MMATKAAPNDDTSRSPLVRAFRRFNFRSSSASPSSSEHPHKPLPRPPTLQPQQVASHQASHSASLPPYLAHLAEPKYASYVPLRFPEPEHAHSSAQRPHQFRPTAHHGADAHRLPPRPPGFVSLTASSSSNAQLQQVPQSLQPGPITVNNSSSQRVAYPWELVPQRKDATLSLDDPHNQPQPSGKENNVNGSGCTSVAEMKTPPRRRPSPNTSPALGSLTPNGSQADPKQPPVKGQCWGKKKDGSRCTRKVKPHGTTYIPPRNVRGASAPPRLAQGASPSAPFVVSSDEDDPSSPTAAARNKRNLDSGPNDNSDEAYCYQHIAEAKKVRGFYHTYSDAEGSTENRVLVKYEEWLNSPDLSDHTQVLLQSRMSRPLTETDQAERGHLYIHELLTCSTHTHICLKVGRSTKVFRRIGEWDSQCRSKHPLLMAIYPADDKQDLLPFKATPTLDGAQFSRRWEALVHLELAGLGERRNEECRDCGKRHREIFMIPRSVGHRDGSNQKQVAGFDLAEEVIVKWLKFVQMLASPDSLGGESKTSSVPPRRPLPPAHSSK